MVELVDTRDLKSRGQKCPYRFDPGLRHHIKCTVSVYKIKALVFKGFCFIHKVENTGFTLAYCEKNEGLSGEITAAGKMYNFSTNFQIRCTERSYTHILRKFKYI